MVEKTISKFRDVASRINFNSHEQNRQVGQLSELAKNYVDNGLRDVLEADLAEAGWGPLEKERITNDLPKEVRQGFSSLPKIKDIHEQINVLPDDPKYDTQAREAFQKRESETDRYKNFIEKEFKTGSYDIGNIVKPGTSLLLLRDEAMKKGMTFQEFGKVISDLKNEGKIKLDKYQKSEEPYLVEHPYKALGMKEILLDLIPGYTRRK